jgi:hypothetical protein
VEGAQAGLGSRSQLSLPASTQTSRLLLVALCSRHRLCNEEARGKRGVESSQGLRQLRVFIGMQQRTPAQGFFEAPRCEH